MSVIGKPISPNPRETNVPDLADLVRSGGYPYIKITLVDPETGGVEIEHQGLAEDVDLALAFQEIALLIAEQEA